MTDADFPCCSAIALLLLVSLATASLALGPEHTACIMWPFHKLRPSHSNSQMTVAYGGIVQRAAPTAIAEPAPPRSRRRSRRGAATSR